MAFELIKSEIIHHGRAFTIRCDTLHLPDEREVRLDIVEHAGSVVILPLDANGEIHFVRQYRHASGQYLLELPAGVLDEGETPEFCAQRELREETGVAAGKLKSLGGFFLAPGYSTEYMSVFLATDLQNAPLMADSDEFISVEHIPVRKALLMCEHGEILDAKSLAAFLLARESLKIQD